MPKKTAHRKPVPHPRPTAAVRTALAAGSLVGASVVAAKAGLPLPATKAALGLLASRGEVKTELVGAAQRYTLA